MQRFRALAWLLAAGLGALALTLLLGRDDPLLPLAAPAADPGAEASAPNPDEETAQAPVLGSAARAGAALRAATERLAQARRKPRKTVADLAATPAWVDFLAVWLRLPAADDDAERLARIQEAFCSASGPVVRQNLIFLAALALPLEVAQPWLEELIDGKDAEDAEDALVALAFTGERSARAAFQRLAKTPASAAVRQVVNWYRQLEAMAEQDTAAMRTVLRSYRAVEAWIREPYFKIVALEAAVGGHEHRDWRRWVGWTPGAQLERPEAVPLIEAWLARYPGHPGSDDMAIRIAWWHVRDGALLDAARWYSLAAVLPDQEMAYDAAASLAGLCEIDLSPEEVLRLSEDEGISTPNRRFFQYVWLRRLAAERGFDVALRELDDYARREADAEVAVAWRSRFRVPPPKGLDSGVTPLPADDPLRRRDSGAIGWPKREHPRAQQGARAGIWTSGSASDALRMEPWPEPVLLDRDRLARQLRAWMTLADLERRADRARGDVRADLLYKQAAVLYHERDALFPVYGFHTLTFGSKMRSLANTRVASDRTRRFERTSLSYVRALDLFERIEREHAQWAGLDKVIFSQGLLWKRLVDYRPSRHHVRWWRSDEPEETAAIRRTVATFERLIERCPDSPLTDDAAAAIAWWRRARPQAFAR